VPNNRNMFLSAPLERAGAAGGMQGTARLAGQSDGGVVISLRFTVLSIELAPRVGLGIGAVLTLVAGLVSLGRVEPVCLRVSQLHRCAPGINVHKATAHKAAATKRHLAPAISATS
jgi:AhpD family alkylhydroperoxidase